MTDWGPIREHYERRLAEFGATAEGVDYRDEGSQRQRFERLEPLALGARSVCDLGCGVGAFASHLRERGYSGDYIGVDLVPSYIHAARVALPGERFEVGSDPVAAEVVVASGIFNVRAQIDDTEWSEHVQRTMAAMWSAATVGIGFNLLSRSVSPHLFSVDGETVLGWIDALHPTHVAMDEDVGLAELTVIARRAQMG